MKTYWDGKLVHLGHSSALPDRFFSLCQNLGDPYQVKAWGHALSDATPTCLRCVTFEAFKEP